MASNTPSDGSQSEPAGTSTTTNLPSRQNDYLLARRYVAYAFLIGGPIIIALPPRKLDLHTAALSAAFLFSANHITHERTGHGITHHMAHLLTPPSTPKVLPTAKAEEVQRQLKERKMRELASKGIPQGKEEEHGEKGGLGKVAKAIWMGGETEDWRRKRAEEEKRALEEGIGYGGLIMRHIREAIGVDKTGEERQQQQQQEDEKKKP
jgi:hypothetical protein